MDIAKEMYRLLDHITQLIDEIDQAEKSFFSNLKIHKFNGKRYGFNQLQELERAKTENLQVSMMEDPELPADKMVIMRLAMERGYDPYPYFANKNLSVKHMAAIYVVNYMTSVDIASIDISKLSPDEILEQALIKDKENRDAAKEIEANVDNIQKEREVNASGEIETNIGSMPFEDYCEIRAMQNGFNSYAEMKREGYSIERPEVKSKQPAKTEQSKQPVGKAR